jgi:hypothetical protein
MKPDLWPLSLYLMLVSFVTAYTQNCVVVGKCNTWAIIMFVIFIITLLLNFAVVVLQKKVTTKLGLNKLKK